MVRLCWNSARQMLNWEAEGGAELIFVSAISYLTGSAVLPNISSANKIFIPQRFVGPNNIYYYIHIYILTQERFIP